MKKKEKKRKRYDIKNASHASDALVKYLLNILLMQKFTARHQGE